MLTLITQSDITAFRQQLSGASLGFVPTMGALHEGHLSLVAAAKQQCDQVLVSIFVNPTQFGPNEDFARYPRTLAEDTALLKQAGVDAVYLPNTAAIYPEGFQTYVVNRRMGQMLCGISRPQLFDGVATVVLKLLNLLKPQKAFFGKKDFQQLKVIEAMVRDLHLETVIVPGDIVRANDGLALSSRNRYLSVEEREQASILYRSLQYIKQQVQNGQSNVQQLNDLWLAFLRQVPTCEVDYAEIRQRDSLEPFSEFVASPAVALLAVRFGQTRLIDNLELHGPL